MAVSLKKSVVIAELEKGGSVKVIAERIGITVPLLKKAAKTFGLNLRRKPTKEVVTFEDDTQELIIGEHTNKVSGKTVQAFVEEVETTHKVSMLE